MAYDFAGATSKRDRRSPKLASTLARLLELEQSENIATDWPEDDDDSGDHKILGLKTIGCEVERKYSIDKRSRSDWEASAEKAMNVALQVRQPKNYPFENASNIKYPLVTVAALQFGARAYPAIVDGNKIVKAQIVGRDEGVPEMEAGRPAMVLDTQTGQPAPGPDGQPQIKWRVPPGGKRAKADRVSAHMSYQLMNEMEEWEEDTDVLLHHLPIVGCCFRKVWRSEELGRNKSEMVPAIHLVVNNRVRSLNEPVPVTHEIYLYPQEIEERQRNGTFLDVELPKPVSPSDREGEVVDGDDDDAPHLFLEQHRYLDLDGDGYREPYIVTVHKDTCAVVRIVANFLMEEIKHDDKQIIRIPKEQYFVKYSFIPDPKGGFYDIGFGKLLESLSETIDTTINQMLDAGHLQCAGGGFIGSGIRLKKNKITTSPGKFEQIETTGKLSDQVMHHQWPGPSAVLFNLLGMMVDAARDITAVKDILTGDTGDKGVQTATTTLALIEQGLKVFTAIYKRVYRALKDEFKLLFKLNARHLEDQQYFNVLDTPQAVAKSDYDIASMDIMPVADPKMVTDMQRTARGNVLLQIAASPLGGAQNPVEALKRVYDSVGMEEPEKLIVQQQGPSPHDQVALEVGMSQAEKNKADAAKSAALANKATVEAGLAPDIAEHKGHMDENKARVDAAKVELQSQQLADAAHRADRHKAVDVGMEHNRLEKEAERADKQFEADQAAAAKVNAGAE